MKITHFSVVKKDEDDTPDEDRHRDCFDYEVAWHNNIDEAFEDAARCYYFGGGGLLRGHVVRLYEDGWSDGKPHVAERRVTSEEDIRVTSTTSPVPGT